MVRNPATEITIDDPQAKAAFVAWWATMEAQGYQYGFEALCNVWVGFDDGRADLARKVLEVVETKRDEYRHECDEAAAVDGGDHPNLWAARARAMSHMADLLRELFAKEGLNIAESG